MVYHVDDDTWSWPPTMEWREIALLERASLRDELLYR